MTKSTPKIPTPHPSTPLCPAAPSPPLHALLRMGLGLQGWTSITESHLKTLDLSLARGALDVRLKVNFHFTIFKSNASPPPFSPRHRLKTRVQKQLKKGGFGKFGS